MTKQTTFKQQLLALMLSLAMIVTAILIPGSITASAMQASVKIEAETAIITAPAKVVNRGDASGGKKVGMIDNANATVTFTVNVPTAGKYRVDVTAGAGTDIQTPGHKIFVNNKPETAQIVSYQATGWDNWKNYPVNLDLDAGENKITLTHSGGATSSYSELDYITLYFDTPKLSALSLDGALLDGFSPDTTFYTVDMGKRPTFPTVSAEIAPEYADQYSLSVKQASIQSPKSVITLQNKQSPDFSVEYTIAFTYQLDNQTTYEAEDAVITAPAKIASHSGASNGKKVGSIDNASATVAFTLTAPKAGRYMVDVYADGSLQFPNPSHQYTVNGASTSTLYYDALGWDIWKAYPIYIELNEGENTLQFTHSGIANSFSELDKIVLHTQFPIFETVAIDGEDFADFSPAVYNYDIPLDGVETLPVVEAALTAEIASEYTIEIAQATPENPAAVITVSSNTEPFSATYTLNFYDQNTFENPLINFGADPFVTYKDGYYYYCRVRNDAEIYVSKTNDLSRIGKAEMKYVYTPPKDTLYSKELWAPELHFVDGKWYIYVAADNGDNANHRTYVLESVTDDAQGEYVMKGKMTDSTDRWAIDATVLELDGKLYSIWSGWEGATNVSQRLYIAEMSNPWTISSERVELSRPEYPWELIGGTPTINEGPQILKAPDGTINIIYSASGSWTDDYCLGRLTLRGDDPMDKSAWEKHDQAIFKKNGTSTFSTGHASFVKSPDETEDYIVYHATRTSGGGWGQRGVRAQKFTWNEDGTPNFGEALPYGSRLPMPSGTLVADRTKYEAERAELTGNATVIKTKNSSNSHKVSGLDVADSGANFTVTVPASGSYKLTVIAAANAENSGLSVQAGNAPVVVKAIQNFGSDNWMGYEIIVSLNAGDNNIFVGKTEESMEMKNPELDAIEIEPVTVKPDGYQITMNSFDNAIGEIGTTFPIALSMTAFPQDERIRSIQAVASIPEGLEIENVALTESALTGAPIEFNVKDGKLYFAIINSHDATDIIATFPNAPFQALTINAKLTQEKAEGDTLALAFDRFEYVTADDQNKNFDISGATSTITFGKQGEEKTVLAKELFTGDGSDVIPAGKKAISFLFTGVENTSDVVFAAETPIQLYYSAQRTEKAAGGQVVYVGLIDETVTAEQLANIENYTVSDTGVKPIVFGNTNPTIDAVVNAQDALNILSAWLRVTDVSADDFMLLSMNVTADAALNTSDAIAVVDSYINDFVFDIITKSGTELN